MIDAMRRPGVDIGGVIIEPYAALLPRVHRVESWPELTPLLRAG
jgi:hypothetical protein